jgi:tRNA-dihydrouridine synthase A
VLSDNKKLAARDLAIFDEARNYLREPIEFID